MDNTTITETAYVTIKREEYDKMIADILELRNFIKIQEDDYIKKQRVYFAMNFQYSNEMAHEIGKLQKFLEKTARYEEDKP